jgi:crotonobetainyl-CoA:carnitine CoA-transferase CaiB-like acyl-CoA transferase
MGPLKGIRVVELAGIGPGPMCAMLLADLGATVLRIERKQPVELGTPRPLEYNLLLRNRQSIALDLKQSAAVELVLALVANADGLIEGFRPGVMERLGLGPDACFARNPRLAYGRMTGCRACARRLAGAGRDRAARARGRAVERIRAAMPARTPCLPAALLAHEAVACHEP